MAASLVPTILVAVIVMARRVQDGTSSLVTLYWRDEGLSVVLTRTVLLSEGEESSVSMTME